ncbi:MAG: hypothetical protein A2234_04085 [Elusimicrobia bacterium RIFOXYA2_FULL_58_8]|nr:MAG: hypothetical protein A2285_08105 [Elusimicrobia bacterium RIFOXYA12_FULL_57_11]OGS15454.1 MAG: hypothetical protein A2234_04085 [Elusimicrobia bacterium RIFOXYA2_FULL_58_8]
MLGLVLTGLRALVKKTLLNSVFSDEFPLFLLMLVFFLISSMFIHSFMFSIAGFQAYLVSFLCFVFVRCAARGLDLSRLYAWINIYLIASGVLILLQVNFAGVFYISGFLGNYGFGLTSQGWGFANSCTLAGGIMGWLLAVQLAHYSFTAAGKVSRLRDGVQLCAIGMGTIGLFYTLSRAAWVGLMLAAVCVYLALYTACRARTNFVKAVLSGVIFLIVFGVLVHPEVYNKKEKLLSFFHFFFSPGATVASDPSVNTRVQAWGVAISGIKSAPVWGIGLDQFPVLYRQAYPELFKSSKGILDLNQNINPHNSYLYYTVEVGILSAFFLLLLIARILVVALREGSSSRVFPFLIGLICVCGWIFTNDFIKERFFWIVLAVASGLAVPGRVQELATDAPTRSDPAGAPY